MFKIKIFLKYQNYISTKPYPHPSGIGGRTDERLVSLKPAEESRISVLKQSSGLFESNETSRFSNIS